MPGEVGYHPDGRKCKEERLALAQLVEVAAGDEQRLVADGFRDAFVGAPVVVDDALKERGVEKGNPGCDCHCQHSRRHCQGACEGGAAVSLRAKDVHRNGRHGEHAKREVGVRVHKREGDNSDEKGGRVERVASRLVTH